MMPRRTSRTLIRCMVCNRFASVLLVAVLLAACGNSQPADSLTPQPVPSQAVTGAATTTEPTETAVRRPTATRQPVIQPIPTVHAPAGAPITSDSIARLTPVAILGRGVPYAIALNDERSMLAAGGPAGVWQYDYPTLDPVRRLASDAPWINAVAWSPDGNLAATGNNQGQIQLWNARTHEVAARLDAGTDPIAAVEWSTNGQALATWAADGRLRLWDTATGSERAAVYAGVPVGWHGLAWSPDGSSLALGSDTGILILDAQTGEATGKLTDGVYKVASVAWSPDGSHVVSGDSDGAIRVWNAGNRQLEQTIPGPSGGAVDLAWSPAGGLLAAAGASGSLSMLRTDTWQEVASWIRLPLGLNAVEWSPDGDSLVWGGTGGVVLVMGVPRVE